MVYGLCVAAVLAGLVAITWQAASLERRELRARVEAESQESLRLALWRMDSMFAPTLALEASRPYFHYQSFYVPERSYTSMFLPHKPDEVLVPSPLLVETSPFVLLHFQLDESQRLTSPQAPESNDRDIAEAYYVAPERVIESERRLARLSSLLLGDASARFAENEVPRDADTASPERGDTPSRANERTRAQIAQQGDEKLASEYALRKEYAQQVQGRSLVAPENEAKAGRTDEPLRPAAPESDARVLLVEPNLRANDVAGSALEVDGVASDLVVLGALKAMWRASPEDGSPQLVMVRQVRVGDRELMQGFWVDWPALSGAMLSRVRDLAPSASLVPVYEGTDEVASTHAGLMLANVPAILRVGPPQPPSLPLLTPTRAALALTWLAVLGAAAAVGVVLRKSIELASRRGRFVTAVTHELRTPLTTFCLYSDMLASGMVGEAAKRQEYLDTLKREASRLARIVESVLEYARLGRSRGERVARPVPVAEMMGDIVPSLRRRTEACGLDLEVDLGAVDGQRVAAEPKSVDRILTNLIDNACKYAGEAADRRVHLTASARRDAVEIVVRDHGPGIPAGEERLIFEPFHRAGRDKEGPNPGLGLGLALCRGLAREMGGELRVQRSDGGGACFVLSMPLCSPRFSDTVGRK